MFAVETKKKHKILKHSKFMLETLTSTRNKRRLKISHNVK